jgi:ABC-2 type transport system permease protein
MSTITTERTATDTGRAARPGRQPRPLAKFWTQLRFMVRRDRVRMPVWVLSFVGLVVASIASVIALYATPEDLQFYATVAQANAAIKALTGPGYGLDDPTQGAVVMNEVALYTYVAIALMCIFMLVRHTRAEEETDRAELVRAAPVGRYATLAAAIVWVLLISLMISVGNVLAMVAFGLPVAGSLAYGAATLLTACVFIGVSAVTAQVAASARASLSMAGAVLGLFFLIRAVGDMGNEWMSWWSPIGVALAIRPFADERWWVLIPLAAISVVLIVVAVRLMGRRDLGAGLMSQRPGPPTASPRLRTPFALAVRLQRTSVIGWLVAIAILGFFFGLVSDQAEAFADNEAIAEMFAQAGEGTITEGFLATIMLMIALFVAGFTVSSVLRLRSEEIALRAEPILATPVDRRRWLASHLGVALLGSLALMIVGGLTTGLGYLAETGDASEILPLLGASLSMFVALAVLAAFTVALVGIDVRWSIGAWAAVAVVLVVGLLSGTLDLAQSVQNISPFTHIPALPAASFDAVPVLLLAAVSLCFTAIAMVMVQRRDIG